MGMIILHSKTFVWPNPIETLLCGQKVVHLKELARISAQRGLEVPLIARITSADDLDRMDMRNVIVKRTYSKCGEHVFVGGSVDKTELTNAMNQQHKYWSGMPAPSQPVWFVQPRLPTTAEKRQVRLVYVNRLPLYGVLTESGVSGNSKVVEELCWVAPLDNVLSVISLIYDMFV